MSVEPDASIVDYDLYDSGTPSGDGSRCGYFQRLGVSRMNADQWKVVREAVQAGRLDENIATQQHELTIGVLRVHDALWLYRFRLGLRDGFGRTGRIIFVLVRCSGSGPVDVALVSRLLSATDDLKGCPLQLAPLNLAATWTGVGSGRANHIARWLTESSIGNGLREGAHLGYHLDGSGGVVQVTQMSQVRVDTRGSKDTRGPVPPGTGGSSSSKTRGREGSGNSGDGKGGGGTAPPLAGRRGVFVPFPTESWQWASVAAAALIVGVLIGSRLEKAEIGADPDNYGARHRVLRLYELSPAQPRPTINALSNTRMQSPAVPEPAVQGGPAQTDHGNASSSPSRDEQNENGKP